MNWHPAENSRFNSPKVERVTALAPQLYSDNTYAGGTPKLVCTNLDELSADIQKDSDAQRHVMMV